MARYVINNPNRNQQKQQEPTSILGQIGQGLGHGLTNFAQRKLQQLHQRQELGSMADRIRGAFPSISPEEAQYVATLPHQYQIPLLQQFHAASQQRQPQDQMRPPMEGQPNMQVGPEQQQQANQIVEQQRPSFLQAISQTGAQPFDRKEQRAEEKHQLELEKGKLAEYEKLEPFLKGQAEDYKNAKNLSVVARRMKENLLKNKKKWPGVTGYLPSGVFRDADIRKYIADANKLVLLSASSRKGQPTNFKVRLEQLTKPELNQPIQTQLDLLDDYIKDADEVFGNQRNIDRIRQENNGRYPRDLAQRLIESQLNDIENPGGPASQLGKQDQAQQNAPQQQPQQEQQQENESPEENWLEKNMRAIGAPAASVASFLGGLPAVPGQLAFAAINYATGGKTPSYREAQEGINKEHPWIPLPKTAEQIRESIDKFSNGVTQSQGEAEQLREDILADTALALIAPPLGAAKAATTGLKIAGALFRSSAGNLSSLAAEKLGAGPLGQTGAKILGMAAASTAGGRKVLRGQMQANYDAATKAAGTDRAAAKPLAENINKMSREVASSDMPGKEFIQQRLQAVNDAISSDRIPVKQARELKVNMNQWRNSSQTPKEAKPYIKRIASDLKKTLDDYGKTNPEFGHNFKAAEDLFSGLGSEFKLAEFTKKFASDNPDAWKNIGSAVVKTLLTAGLVGTGSLVKGVGGGVGAASGIVAGREAYKIYRLLSKSPQAVKYYKEAAQAALKNDSAAFIKSATKLDQIAQKYEDED